MKQISLTAMGRRTLTISKEEYATLSASQFVHSLHWLPESHRGGLFALSRQQRKNLQSLCQQLSTQPLPDLHVQRAAEIADWLRSARLVRLAVSE